jgi:hypothetical protein
VAASMALGLTQSIRFESFDRTRVSCSDSDLIFTGDKCKAEMEKLQAELEKVAAEKDAAVAHQNELQDALDAANKQLKKEAIVIASKDEFIKTLIQTPAAA